MVIGNRIKIRFGRRDVEADGMIVGESKRRVEVVLDDGRRIKVFKDWRNGTPCVVN